MNLRRSRVELTVVATALVAVAAVIGAVVAWNVGSDRIEAEAEQEASVLLLEMLASPDTDIGNAWVVDPVEEWVDPFADTWVEPPLFSIASQAGGFEPAFLRFEQDGTWLTASRLLPDGLVLVVAVDDEPTEQRMSSLRWRLVLLVLVLVAAAAAAVWRFAGRVVAPAGQAMARQRDFIADAAHELRTPLAVIQASASQALARDRESWEYQRSLAEIQVAAERAGTGVGSLLEMARLESGQAAPRLAPLRLDLLAEEVVAATAIEGVEVVADVDAGPVIVSADYALLRQAVVNLVANAAARASSVVVRVVADDPWARLEVLDDGPGIDPETAAAAFDRFRRGDRQGAAGLGLSIVRTIVDAHRGSVALAGRPEGGAVATIALRLAG